MRLDVAMVHRGLARSRRRAAELVAEGRVSVGGDVARKPAQQVRDSDELRVAESSVPEYVSRAGHKLVGALDAVARLAPGALEVIGARCLDAGACTGGFTQVLLERGAGHVTAVDVGHGQLSPVVAEDPAVTALEGTDVRDLTAASLGSPPSVVVADLSFISLTLVTERLVALAAPGANLLLMVKPQFEVGRERLGSGGVVRSVELRGEALLGVAAAARRAGATVRGVVPSPLPGPAGNHEYFLWLVAPGPVDPLRAAVSGRASVAGLDEHSGEDLGEEITSAVRAAVTAEQPTLIGAGAAALPAPVSTAGGPVGTVRGSMRATGGPR